MALMLYTGQRRSDVVRMGRQHVTDGWIAVRQQKTGAPLRIPLHPALRAILDVLPATNMTFILTDFGKPFTAAGFGNWFRERCDEAGLPQCSAHGLRKAASRRLAEAGCSHSQIKAVTGHKTDREVARYTAGADQLRLAGQAIEALSGPEREQDVSTRPDGLAKSDDKRLIEKGI